MKTYLTRILALAATAFLLGLTGYAATTITAVPFTITNAGNYALGSDLIYSGAGFTAAITVNANNVVLDLGGFSLYGTGASRAQIGISISSLNVTIQNGNISSFDIGVNSEAGFQYVQSLRFFYNDTGVYLSGNNSTIQNCFIEGNGSNSVGVLLPGCTNVLVTNCQISDESTGGYSLFSGGGNSFIANQLMNCNTGLSLNAADKYQGNVTVGCTTPFSGGTAAGYENN